jgi:hypothetical protein
MNSAGTVMLMCISMIGSVSEMTGMCESDVRSFVGKSRAFLEVGDPFNVAAGFSGPQVEQ